MTICRFPLAQHGPHLRERFREDRLGLTASSLTFTTTIALVPLITVALAVFTAFPMFGKLQVCCRSG
jgi:membrane protein